MTAMGPPCGICGLPLPYESDTELRYHATCKTGVRNAMDLDRQTGRTARQLARCLELAAKGEDVVFVVISPSFAEYCLAMIGRGGEPFPKVRDGGAVVNRRGGPVIEYPNGGSLTFIPQASDPRRLQGSRIRIRFDHSTSPNMDWLAAHEFGEKMAEVRHP